MKSPALRRWIGIVVAAVVLAVTVPFPAAAQVGVSSSPAADSTVTTEIEIVSLTFSDELVDIGGPNGEFNIRVVGPDGRFYNLGCVQLEGETAVTSVALGESGSYEVTWQADSDGERLPSGTFKFVYEKPADTVADAGSATTPCVSGDRGDAADPADNGSHTADEARTVTGILFVGGVLLALLLVAAIAVVVMGSRNRRRLEPDSDQQPE